MRAIFATKNAAFAQNEEKKMLPKIHEYFIWQRSIESQRECRWGHEKNTTKTQQHITKVIKILIAPLCPYAVPMVYLIHMISLFRNIANISNFVHISH